MHGVAVLLVPVWCSSGEAHTSDGGAATLLTGCQLGAARSSAAAGGAGAPRPPPRPCCRGSRPMLR